MPCWLWEMARAIKVEHQGRTNKSGVVGSGIGWRCLLAAWLSETEMGRHQTPRANKQKWSGWQRDWVALPSCSMGK